jgi:hypothetical protein
MTGRWGSEYHFLLPSRDPEGAARRWERLRPLGVDTYFLSWGLLGNWLQALPASVEVPMLLLGPRETPNAGCLVGRSWRIRGRLFPRRCCFVNASGIRDFDNALWLEYNQLLVGNEPTRVLEGLVQVLAPRCHEIVFAALDATGYPGLAFTDPDFRLPGFDLVVDRRLPCHYVDLAQVRRRGDYLDLLRSNTRQQIRRSRRLLAVHGTPRVEVPQNLDAALTVFRQLTDLHRAHFLRRGQRSFFATEFAQAMHEGLIRARFRHGEIQLLRIAYGDRVVGCLYNFVHGGRVYFFQGGFVPFDDKRIKPGLTCHAAAIGCNADLGWDVYDFLAGDERYKASLATDAASLVWGRIHPSALCYRLEDRLLALLRRLRSALRRPG